MENEAVVRLIRMFGKEPSRVLRVQKGYRNESYGFADVTGTMYNLIIYKDEPRMAERIRRTNLIGDYVAAHGLPARATADARILQIQSPTRLKYAALYCYLPGATIPWEAYTKKHIKLLGGALSTMHAALRKAPAFPEHAVAREYQAILQRMQAYFTDSHVVGALAHKLGVRVTPTLFSRLHSGLDVAAQLPGQALHMDFVRGNILFDGDADTLHISGILDFEKTAWGHPLFDIARTLAFLMVDCKYKQEHKVRTYFLASGYTKRGLTPYQDSTFSDMTENDISLTELLIDLFLLHDIYKFLKHNPYEPLHINEHFVRTKQISIKRNILSSC